jgi:hypothetical protein
MKTFNIKIQSTSDIITNSSSEVFMVYDGHAFKKIKELVNAILAATGYEQTFDDMFEIKPHISEDFVCEYPEYSDLSEEELLEKAYEHDNDRYDGWPVVDSYVVTAKDEKNEKLADILSGIDGIFETYAMYC